MKAKDKFAEDLHLKYKQQKEERYESEIMQKSAKEALFRSSHMQAIDRQLKEKLRDDELQRKKQAELDKRQLDFKVAEDEQKIKAEEEKNLARRKHAQGLM